MSRYIDADALKDAIQAERDHLTARGQKGAEHILCHHAYRLIDDAPTVDAVKVKHGHWINDRLLGAGGKSYLNKRCSVCRNYWFAGMSGGWDYCPKCGAKMDEVTE